MKVRCIAGVAGLALLSLVTAPVAAASPPDRSVAPVVSASSARETAGLASPTSAHGYVVERRWTYSGAPDHDVRGVAASHHDEVFVTGGDDQVKRYDLRGTLLSSWHLPAGAASEAIAVDPRNGDVHVGVWGGDGGVLVYSRSGHYVRQYAVPGGDTWVTGIAVSSDGRSFVSNAGDRKIHRFSTSGAHEASFAGGMFPADVTLSPSGTLLVADSDDDVVRELTTSGATVRTWGQAGALDGQLLRPNSIAVAPGGNLLVSDISTSRVQEFTSTGTFVRVLDETPLSKNFALSFDRHGALYVGGFLHDGVEGVVKFAPAAPSGKKTKITVKARKKTHGKRSKVNITVSRKATGTVSVKAGKRTVTGRLKAGKVTVRLPKKFPKPGNRTITVSYAGVPGQFRPSSTAAKVRVVKASPKVKVKSFKKRVKQGKKARFRITVTAPGLTPGGRVRVNAKGAKARTVKLNKKGRANVRLSFRKNAKPGKRTLTVTYRGTKHVKKVKLKKGTITVRR